MKNKQISNLWMLYAWISLLYLASIYMLGIEMQVVLKGLLMPILMYIVYQSSYTFKSLLLTALLYSWVGDILLEFTEYMPTIFIAGLVSFLVAQICYFFIFKYEIQRRFQTRGYRVSAWNLMAISMCTFLAILIPKLGPMTLPILAYTAAISAMLICAIKATAHLPISAGKWVLAGATTFVLSDSLIAFNKFHTPIPHADLLIMVTYIYAQGALVYGFLKSEKSFLPII